MNPCFESTILRGPRSFAPSVLSCQPSESSQQRRCSSKGLRWAGEVSHSFSFPPSMRIDTRQDPWWPPMVVRGPLFVSLSPSLSSSSSPPLSLPLFLLPLSSLPYRFAPVQSNTDLYWAVPSVGRYGRRYRFCKPWYIFYKITYCILACVTGRITKPFAGPLTTSLMGSMGKIYHIHELLEAITFKYTI